MTRHRGLNYSIQPRCGYSRRQRLPVYLRLEGRCGLIDRTLGVLAANQHQTTGKPSTKPQGRLIAGW